MHTYIHTYIHTYKKSTYICTIGLDVGIANFSPFQMINVYFFFKVGHRSRSQVKMFYMSEKPLSQKPTCQI